MRLKLFNGNGSWRPGTSTTIPPPPVVPPVQTTFKQHPPEGWVCPNCKRGIAPFMFYCPFCNTSRVETREDTQL